MKKKLITPPLVEPISLSEAKLHLRVDHSHEDSLISDLITACRQLVEDHLNLALIEQTWQWTFDRWEDIAKFKTIKNDNVIPFGEGVGRYVCVPRGQIISVVSINTFDENNVSTPWDISNLLVVDGSNSICLKFGMFWPKPKRKLAGVEVTYKAGFGSNPGDIPAPIRQAILMMVRDYYELRGLGQTEPVTIIPSSSLTMLSPYKSRRL